MGAVIDRKRPIGNQIMSATSPCVPCCPTSQSVNIPGVQGDDGDNGTNGVNAFSLVTVGNNVPAAEGDPLTLQVDDSTWMVIGQILIVEGPSNYIVTALPTSTSVTMDWLNYPGDVTAGNAIAAGDTVSPAGLRGAGTVYYRTTAVDLTLNEFMDTVEVTAASRTMTLPTAVGIEGKMYTVKLTANGPCTLDANGIQTIDGELTFVLQAKYDFVTVVSNGANWLVVVKHTNHYTATAITISATLDMDFIDVTSDNHTINLPTAVGIAGKIYTIMQTDTFTSGTIVEPAGAETINGAANKTIAVTNGYIQIISNGANWLMLFNKLT